MQQSTLVRARIAGVLWLWWHYTAVGPASPLSPVWCSSDPLTLLRLDLKTSGVQTSVLKPIRILYLWWESHDKRCEPWEVVWEHTELSKNAKVVAIILDVKQGSKPHLDCRGNPESSPEYHPRTNVVPELH